MICQVLSASGLTITIEKVEGLSLVGIFRQPFFLPVGENLVGLLIYSIVLQKPL